MMANVIQLPPGGKVQPPKGPNPFEWLTWKQIAIDPLPPMPWVCEALQIGPGRPCGLWGYGGSGKSWVANALGLSVVSGRDFLGRYPVRRGRVVHVSHEMGRRASAARYRRLGSGLLLEPDEVGNNFKLAVHPRFYLNDPRAEDWYRYETEGFDLCIIDSLRRALPGVNENDSIISNYLDILARISDKNQCAFIVLHHSGKGAITPDGNDGKNKQYQKDERGAGRGSSAIEDASSSVWKVEGSGKGPRRMVMARAHEESEDQADPFWITLDTIARPEPIYADVGRQGVRLICLDQPEVDRIERASRRKGNLERWQKECRAIVATVTDHQQCSVRQILRELGDLRSIRETIKDLIEGGVLSETKGEKRAKLLSAGEVSIERFLDPVRSFKRDLWGHDDE